MFAYLFEKKDRARIKDDDLPAFRRRADTDSLIPKTRATIAEADGIGNT
jgi:hypothetical protein